MKIKFYLTVALCFFVININAGEGNNIGLNYSYSSNSPFKMYGGKDIADGGFFLLLGTYIPSTNFGFPSDFDNTTGDKFGFGASFEIGTMFKLSNISDHSVQLRVTWFEANYSRMQASTESVIALQGSTLKLGPAFTYALNRDMSIDAYYQISPVFMTKLSPSGYYDIFSLGTGHNLGVAYRYSIFTAGLSYYLGKAKDFDANLYDNIDPELMRYRLNSLRLFLGFKF